MMVGETAAFNIVAVIDRARQKDFLGGILPLGGPMHGGPKHGGPKHGGPSKVPWESPLALWGTCGFLRQSILFVCDNMF